VHKQAILDIAYSLDSEVIYSVCLEYSKAGLLKRYELMIRAEQKAI
jgi:hypothetical protein